MRKIIIPLVTSTFILSFDLAQNIFAKPSLKIAEHSISIEKKATPTISNKLNENKPKIQIAILLDSSNSMDGLIELTRTQIWSVINAVSKITKNGENPIFEVSLYHYGNNTLPSAEGFNRMLNQLTTDLDQVSENLFSIKTNGGEEYAGEVINSAINQLNWSYNSQDFRVIFIAGNEPFNQGSFDWQKAINSAIQKDVIVNTIYCGESENSESNLWANAANKGKGSYFNLNQDERVISIPTPYDAEIVELNQQLNDTYIPFGNQGLMNYQRQQTQDSNAFSSPNSAAGINRAVTKTTGNYRNSSWDLVDGVTDNTVDLNSLDKTTLPENLRSLTVPEINKYVEIMREKRVKIKAKIAELSQKRTEYIAKNTPKDGTKKTLDSLMIDTLYKQLSIKGFQISK